LAEALVRHLCDIPTVASSSRHSAPGYCHFGGFRPWLHCPHCERRVARLFKGFAGYFCRVRWYARMSRNGDWCGSTCPSTATGFCDFTRFTGQTRRQARPAPGSSTDSKTRWRTSPAPPSNILNLCIAQPACHRLVDALAVNELQRAGVREDAAQATSPTE
jgi:hypothetical protein